MRAPFLHVVPWYVAGILLGHHLDPPLSLIFLTGVAAAGLCLHDPKRSYVFLAVALVAAGWANLAWRTRVVSPRDLRLIVGETPALVEVVGRIAEEPIVKKHVHGGAESWSTSVLLDVRSLVRNRAGEAACGQLLVRNRGLLEDSFEKGSLVRVRGVLDLPPVNRIRGLFNYRTHLKNEGVYHVLETGFADDWRMLEPANDPLAFLHGFRGWARATLVAGLPGDDGIADLLQAMTLGWKAGLTQEVREPFMQSGTMHVFAISGLHIAIVGAILVELLRVLLLTRRQSAGAVIVLLWLYVVATGEQPSAIRAATMMTVVLGGLMLKRPSSFPNSVAAAAVLILVFDPLALFQIGFQLSFSVVGTLAVLGPVFEKWIGRIRLGDPFLPDELRPAWLACLQWTVRWTARSLAVSTAAWLGSLPLIALYFNYLTPGSVLANLVVVPAGMFAISSAFGSWIAAALHLSVVSGWFNWSAWFLMSVMVRCSDWIAGLDGAWWNVRSPNPAAVTVYYLVLVAFGTGWFLRSRRHLVAASLAVVTMVGIAVLPRVFDRGTSLWVLPTGGGHVVFVEKHSGNDELLIDCGDAYTYDAVTKPWMRGRGIDRVANLAITHGDARHMAAAGTLMGDFRVGHVATPDARFRSSYFRALEESLAADTNVWARLSLGDSVAGFAVVHPPEGTPLMKADDVAMALLGTVGNRRVLLLPDPTIFSQESILTNNPGIKADIVIAGLPDSGEVLSRLFLERLEPGLVVICSDAMPASAVEDSRLKRLAEEVDFEMLFTSETGGLELRIGDGSVELVGPSGRIVGRVKTQKSPRP